RRLRPGLRVPGQRRQWRRSLGFREETAMKIGDWAATPDLNDIYRDIRALGLETNLAELEAFGFTVIEGALSPDEVKATRDKIIEISEARLDRKLDLDAERDYADLSFIPFLLFKDPIFKVGLLNPR